MHNKYSLFNENLSKTSIEFFQHSELIFRVSHSRFFMYVVKRCLVIKRSLVRSHFSENRFGVCLQKKIVPPKKIDLIFFKNICYSKATL